MFVPTQPHGIGRGQRRARQGPSLSPIFSDTVTFDTIFLTLFLLHFYPLSLSLTSLLSFLSHFHLRQPPPRQSPPPSPPVKPHKTLSSSSLLSTPPLVSVHVIVFNNPNLITFQFSAFKQSGMISCESRIQVNFFYHKSLINLINIF